MSRLMDLVDAYRATQGWPSEASIARGIDVLPQTMNAWRKRGLKELPETETLKRLATFINQPLRVVVDAALVDMNLLASADATPARPYTADRPNGNDGNRRDEQERRRGA